VRTEQKKKEDSKKEVIHLLDDILVVVCVSSQGHLQLVNQRSKAPTILKNNQRDSIK
jgi:hypothetical protein